MAGPEEVRIIRRFEQEFSDKFDIETSAGKNSTWLPRTINKRLYLPDMIFRDKRTGKIVYIIEVETDPVRKALVGACIMADYCIGIDQADGNPKPKLIFVIGKKGEGALQNFRDRIPIMKSHISYLDKEIIIDTEERLLQLISLEKL